MTTVQDLFGNPSQLALLAKGRAMYDILSDDPRYTYYGRTVGICMDHGGTVDQLCALIRLQGNASDSAVATTDAEGLGAALEAHGFQVTRYARLEGGAEPLAAARAVLDSVTLPDDLEIVRLTPDTPQDIRAAFAEMALECGVLPPTLEVMSGALKPGLLCLAVEPSGRVVSCAGAAGYLHADHREGHELCWWGMLATRPDRRGARLSLYLGALCLTEMAKRYGFTRFMTGVVRGNAASEAVCTRLGLKDLGIEIVGAADPVLLPGGRMTK